MTELAENDMGLGELLQIYLVDNLRSEYIRVKERL